MMQSVQRSMTLAVLVIASILALAPVAAHAQAFTFTDVFQVPDFEGPHFCGEVVSCSGTTLIVVHGTINKNGSRFAFHENDQGVTCVGEDSGLTYRSTYHFNESDHNFLLGDCLDVPCVATASAHWDLRAPGPRNDLRNHFLVHFTFNANGVLTADFLRDTTTCE